MRRAVQIAIHAMISQAPVILVLRITSSIPLAAALNVAVTVKAATLTPEPATLARMDSSLYLETKIARPVALTVTPVTPTLVNALLAMLASTKQLQMLLTAQLAIVVVKPAAI